MSHPLQGFSESQHGFGDARKTTAERIALTVPNQGYCVWDTDIQKPFWWSGSAWLTYEDLRGIPVATNTDLTALSARDFEIRKVLADGKEYVFELGATSGTFADDANTGFWKEVVLSKSNTTFITGITDADVLLSGFVEGEAMHWQTSDSGAVSVTTITADISTYVDGIANNIPTGGSGSIALPNSQRGILYKTATGIAIEYTTTASSSWASTDLSGVTETFTVNGENHYRNTNTTNTTWNLTAGDFGLFTIHNQGTGTLTLNSTAFYDGTSSGLTTVVIPADETWTLTRQTGGALNIVSKHPEATTHAKDSQLIDGTVDVDALLIDMEEEQAFHFMTDGSPSATPTTLTSTLPFTTRINGVSVGSQTSPITIPVGTIGFMHKRAGQIVVFYNTDVDWAISVQDRVSEVFDTRQVNGDGVVNFNPTFTPEASGYYTLRHFGNGYGGNAIIRVGTAAGADDVFITSVIADRINVADPDRKYLIELAEGVEYHFSTQAGGGADWSNLGFEIYPASSSQSEPIDLDLDIQLREWQKASSVQYLQSRVDGMPVVKLEGSTTGQFSNITTAENIPEVDEDRTICIEWFIEVGATHSSALRLGRSGFVTDLILDHGLETVSTNAAARLINVKNYRTGNLVKTVATFTGQATAYTAWTLFADYGNTGTNTSAAGATGALNIKSLDLDYVSESDVEQVAYFGVFSKEGPSGGTSGQFTTNINGIDATYENLINATDQGAGLLQLNGGSNSNFNSHATTVEKLECGDYIEFVKGQTSDFHTEAFSLSQGYIRDAQLNTGQLRVQFTENNHTLFDGSGNQLAQTTDATHTWRFTRYAGGFVVMIDGVEVYRDPKIPPSVQSVTGHGVNDTDALNPVLVNNITAIARRWNVGNNAPEPVDAYVYGQDATVLGDVDGNAAYYILGLSTLFESNPIDTSRIFKFKFARNLPDVTTTLVFRFFGATGNNNDIIIDPVAGTFSPEANVTVVGQRVTDSFIEVAFKHDVGGYTSMRLHPIWGNTGSVANTNSLTGVQYLLDMDLDYTAKAPVELMTGTVTDVVCPNVVYNTTPVSTETSINVVEYYDEGSFRHIRIDGEKFQDDPIIVTLNSPLFPVGGKIVETNGGIPSTTNIGDASSTGLVAGQDNQFVMNRPNAIGNISAFHIWVKVLSPIVFL